MTLHLVKLAAGAASVEDLQSRVDARVAAAKSAGRGAVAQITTRMFPRRRDELLDGGSLYWVVKGVVLVRQEIRAIDAVIGEDGVSRCAISLIPALVETEAQPRRAFQGWRYLPAEEAPADLKARGGNSAPPVLRAKLAELGLL